MTDADSHQPNEQPHASRGGSPAGIDRSQICPICHHDDPKPEPPMNGFAMRACPRCLGRWVVCNVEDLPDYDLDYETAERLVYRRYQIELEQIQAGADPPVYWFQRRQLERIAPFGRARLLEVGCGNGMFLLAARRAGWQAEGLDVSEHAAQLATQLSGCPVHTETPAELVANGAAFEVISGFEILEHVFDPLADLGAMVSLLVPNGVLTLSVPNDRSPHTRNPRDPEGRPPYHINFFQPRTLERMLRDVGLEIMWLYEKPFAWSETHRLPAVRLLMLPWSAFAGYVLGQRGSRLVAWARKPSAPPEHGDSLQT